MIQPFCLSLSMCKWGSHWRWLSGAKRCLLCWHLPPPPVLDYGTEGEHWIHSGDILNEIWRAQHRTQDVLCHSRFIRQKLPFLGTQRSTLLWSTATLASLGFHAMERGVWKVCDVPIFLVEWSQERVCCNLFAGSFLFIPGVVGNVSVSVITSS